MSAFDGRVFDTIFDTPAVVIRPTLGGWANATRTQPAWAPNDQMRGTQWNTRAKGTATW